MKQSRPPRILRTLLVASALLLAAHPPAPAQQAAPARQITSSVVLRWPSKRGVERYRLQVASDARFRDIVFDAAVVGLEYRVTGLAPGTYYWRVATADGETGPFSRPEPVVVVAEAPARPAAPPVIDASLNAGWRTATGEVAWLAAAELRAGRGDLVSVNKDGMVHALDGTTGVAL
ncbi:MAG TPA: hypothetical protein VEQ42_04725, partial [Pyrinomonadaceae bacterium]|nr:hypothetical protein [Pyrinomonadaceae bacterium]